MLGSVGVANASGGDFTLAGANVVNRLAGNVVGDFIFNNTVDTEIADLTFTSFCGTLESICGLTVDGDAALSITGDLTQSGAIVVGGTTDLIASGVVWLTGADCDGDGLNDNDFAGVVTANAASVELVDRNDLNVGDITAVDDIYLRAGDVLAGNLTIGGNLLTSAADGQVLLQSRGDTTQVAGAITTNDLVLGSETLVGASGGDFTLTGANVVNRLAGNVVGDFTFSNTVDTEIADLTFTSACGTFESICGLTVGGDAVLTITGDLTQSGSIFVGGMADLTASGVIWLTGADCDGDGFNDNDFVGVVTAMADSVELVDRNDLAVGDVIAVDDIYLRAGDVVAGNLTIGGNLVTSAADGQVLLQSRGNTTQTAGTIQTNDLVLGSDTLTGASGGNFTLTGANAVNRLAGNVVGDFFFNNTVDTEIADLTFTSVCGTLETICGLRVGGDTVLGITGNLTQSASIIAGGSTDITATGFICLTGADCDGDGLNDNDFVGIVTASGTTVELVDRNDLNVGDITATSDIFLRAGDVDAGDLNIGGNLLTSAADGQVLLQSRGNTTQTAGTITTNDLLLGSEGLVGVNGGNFTLNGANVVNQLASNVVGNLIFNNTVDTVIAELTYDSICDTTETICGVDVGGNVILTIDGDLTQTAAIIVGGTTEIVSTGVVCLTGGDCDGDGLNDNDFVGVVTASGTTVELVDRNDLSVGDIDAVNDVFLRAGDNGAGGLTIGGDITTTAVAGQVLLQADDGATQLLGSVISTSELLLGGNDADEGSGDFNLNGDNVVANLAADLQASLTFTNVISVNIGNLNYESECLTTEAICGVDLGGDLVLNVIGDITQDAAIIVAGTARIDATGAICLTGGDCDLDGLNDNDFVGQVDASGTTVELVDRNALTVGTIAAVDDIYLRSGDNGTGALRLNGNLTTSLAGGQILLQSDNGITQAATSIITTDQLLIGGDDADVRTGSVILGSNNSVNQLAASLADSLTFQNNRSLEIANLTYDSTCGTTQVLCGLDIGGNLILDVVGVGSQLTQSASVVVAGIADLSATTAIYFDGGDCDADGLNDNDFVGQVNADSRIVEIVDRNDLITGDINAVEDIFLRSGDNGTGSITLNGNLVTAQATGQVLMQSDAGVTQNAGTITANQLLLGGNEIDEGSGDFLLVGDNRVNSLAANLRNGTVQLVNNNNLTIAAGLNYATTFGTKTESISGINIGGEGALLDAVYGDPDGDLSDTSQGADRNGTGALPSRLFNPSERIDTFLNTDGAGVVNDIGVAIENTGSLTTMATANVIARQADVYLKTNGGNVDVNSIVMVAQNENQILTVAGQTLNIGPAGQFVRGTDGLVTEKFNNLTLLNPGTLGSENAIIDTDNRNQLLDFTYASAGEMNFETVVFWGLEGIADDSLKFDGLSQAQLNQLEALLYGGTGFESRSFYGIGTTDGKMPFTGTAIEMAQILSQPIGNTFDNGGNSLDGGFPIASFTQLFLSSNPEFRNVQFIFNDAQINLFENADATTAGGLVDLNVATDDFQGLARVGRPRPPVAERPDVQIPERVEISTVTEPEFFQSVVVDQQPLFVQTVQENFVVVVYFESQFEADQFEAEFEKLGANEDGDELNEKDFEAVKKEILDVLGLDSFQWNLSDKDGGLDVNQLRELLLRAGLDLDDDDESQWLERYQEWLKSESADGLPPELPRGIYKIIEVDNGNAVIQGDDIDRRFVPEPDNESDFEDYPFEDTNQPQIRPQPDAELPGDDVSTFDGGAASGTTRYAGMSTAATALLAIACRKQSNPAPTIDEELESLTQQKSDIGARNIFSRASRFRRRNQALVNHDQ